MIIHQINKCSVFRFVHLNFQLIPKVHSHSVNFIIGKTATTTFLDLSYNVDATWR